jgi:hypothetical protein
VQLSAERDIFEERLAQYLTYVRPAAADSDILQVKFNFLSEGREQRVQEVVGLVRNRESSSPE